MRTPYRLGLFSGVVFGVSLALAPCFAGQAQPSAIQTIREDSNYRIAVQNVLQAYESSLRTHCPTVQADWGRANARVYPPVDVDDKSLLVNATWVETVPGNACGRHRTYNTLNLVRDGRASVQPLFPGESNASPVLQQDSLVYVGSAVAGKDVSPKCRIDVLETQFAGGAPAKEGIPWNERWRVDACGKQFFVTLHYLPDATGTTINVDPEETIPADPPSSADAQ